MISLLDVYSDRLEVATHRRLLGACMSGEPARLLGVSLASVDIDREVSRRLIGLNKRQRQAVSDMYRSIARQSETQTMRQVRSRLVDAMAEAAHLPPRERAKFLDRAVRRCGIDPGESALIRTLARTHQTIADVAATWAETRFDPRVWGYEYVARDDERTRPEHWALNGARFPKEHRFWQVHAPPNGWNCRCRLKPIYRGSRAAVIRLPKSEARVDPGFRFNPGRLLIVV